MPSLFWSRQEGTSPMPSSGAPTVSSAPSLPTSTGKHASGHLATGAMVGAIIAPIILIIALITICIIVKRKKRNASSSSRTSGLITENPENASMSQRVDNWFHIVHQAFNHPHSETTTTRSRNGAVVIPTQTQATSDRQGRRGRRNRLRRTDSGATVKTLPEYDELREDEILLYKALDPPADLVDSLASMEEAAVDHERQETTGSRRSSRTGRRSSRRGTGTHTTESEAALRGQSSSPARGSESRRQSSLGSIAADSMSALRRISLRRTESSRERSDTNEMDSMLSVEASAAAAAAVDHPVSTIIEEPEAYDSLYPTLSVQTTDSEPIERAEGSERRGVGALRSIFQRQAAGYLANHRRIASANPSMGDLSLVPTRSNDNSLYRPSTSSSRRVFGGFIQNGSSASLLSQSGAAESSTDTLGRASFNSVRHTRNISAPISTKRLQFAPPIAGFSDKQMQFLTSVESLDKYGIPLQDGSLDDGQRLPAFEELARHQEAAVRLPRLAPVLTTAEVQARQEQSPISALPLMGHPESTDDIYDDDDDDNNNISNNSSNVNNIDDSNTDST
ncbi:hypothetical protein CBS101457_004753 [Exobasidium rhododendri]|nr:hypothetical protein CBS101457_004753 [Exobasidium rhododendri]